MRSDHARADGPHAERGRRATRRLSLLLAVTLCLPAAGCRSDEAAVTATTTISATEATELYNRGCALLGRFDYDGAVKVFERLTESAYPGKTSEVRVDLAIALLNRRQDDDLSRAAELLDGVILSAPENLRASYCRALLRFHDGQTAEARDLFRRVAEGDPADSYAVYYVGQCLFSEGDFAAALERFETAQRIDPYLRSAYYGAFQAVQRLGDRDRARAELAEFQRLATNPRAGLAELKYTRMGPKAEAHPPNSKESHAAAKPEGPLFGEPAAIALAEGVAIRWREFDADDGPPTITVADLDGDGASDLFLAGAVELADGRPGNAVLLRRGDRYEAVAESPLAQAAGVTAVLWGDYDDDGLVDVYLCRRGPNQLWRQAEKGRWQDVSVEAGVAAGDHHTTDGAIYDLDHDGDLDLLLANADGPTQVLSNNRDGTFRSIADELGLAGDGRPVRRVVLADLDTDDDADLVYLHDSAPHEVFLNDRLWEYHPAEGFDGLTNASATAAVALDSDVDGQVELFLSGSDSLRRWAPNASGVWEAPDDSAGAGSKGELIGLFDVDGDGEREAITRTAEGWAVTRLDGRIVETLSIDDTVSGTACLIGASGPELIACRSGGPPLRWPAGQGRFDFTRVRLAGRTDKAAEMRSNSSGIGVRGVARLGPRWAPLPASRQHAGPGQSLQPLAIGMGGAERVDFVRLLWPDAVSQTEIDLAPGPVHAIAETQRQAGSCPLLFVWNGERYAFVADLLGAGGIGFNLGKGEYYDARPTEHFLLPEGLLHPRSDRFVVKLGEPMEEICYFDAVRLVAYDLPPGWRMTLDERFGASEPLPTGEPVFYRRELLPVSAVNDRGQDITEAIAERDARAAPLDRTDRRFIGRSNPHSVTLTFEEPLDALDSPVLLFDGWIEYAYSQTAFAAWQAGESYVEPTIEARGADGRWRAVFERFGYMAGTPREASVPLDPARLPPGTRELRISSNLQIYWDRFAVIDSKPLAEARRHEAPLSIASVEDVGFSVRTLGDQRHTVYDYDQRPPLGDTRHPRGFYTAFGDALELVQQTDDALAIIGPGEELHLEYAATETPPPAGWTRRWVIEADGWCKDADLFTQDGGRVEPLPVRSHPPDSDAATRVEELHNEYNTRYRDGW